MPPHEVEVLDEAAVPMVIDPVTGEAIVIREARTNDLAGFLARIREQEQVVKEWKRAVTIEIARRQDADASWTTHTAEWTVEGSAATERTEYDAEALYVDLGPYVEAGHITEAARERAVERAYTYKAKAGGIKALAKLGGEIAEVIAKHTIRTPKARYVTVRPRKGSA